MNSYKSEELESKRLAVVKAQQVAAAEKIKAKKPEPKPAPVAKEKPIIVNVAPSPTKFEQAPAPVVNFSVPKDAINVTVKQPAAAKPKAKHITIVRDESGTITELIVK